MRRLVDADLELASAFGRDPLCSYQGPGGMRPSRIDGLLVDTRPAALLHAAELLPRGAIPGHILVRYDLHLKGASQRVLKFIRPKPVELAPREEHESQSAAHARCTPLGVAPMSCAISSNQWRTSRRGPWAAWMCAKGQVSSPPVSLHCFGQRRTSGSSWSVSLPRGRCGGASGKAAPAGRESGATSGQARARRVSSAAVVQNAQAWSTSPVDRAAHQPASRGSRRRCTRRSPPP